MFLFGALAGLLWMAIVGTENQAGSRAASRQEEPGEPFLDAGLAALTLGLIGARAAFVLLHWNYYSAHPEQAWWFWQGGLSWFGGIIGALIGLGFFARFSRTPFWAAADALAIPAALLAFAAWTGCLIDGCAYGRSADFGLLTPRSPDLLGTPIPRWPTQSTGALMSLAALAILIRLRRRLPLGVLACLSLSMIVAATFLLSFFRADPVGVAAGLRFDTLGALALLLPGLAMLGWRTRRTQTGMPV